VVPAFSSREGVIALYERLQDELPIIPPTPRTAIEFQVGGSPQPMTLQSSPLQMLDRSRTRSVTVGPSALIVQTTDYARFEEFLDFTALVLRAVSEVATIAAIERVGLRYINEIRIAGVKKPLDWVPFIHTDLLAPTRNALGGEVSAFNTLTEFVLDDMRTANMRAGALSGRIVDPTGPLKLKSSEVDGPFFLIDIDSVWAPPMDELPSFEPEDVCEICSRLHDPASRLFESALTDQSRAIFRGGVNSSGKS
jgi:uncharacterized protein (TIGR04255 family)